MKNFSSKSTLYSCGVDFLFTITQSAFLSFPLP
nr:MAG TPA: hypothetical protein [Bacteriophage sp.]DAT40032.1 MAG TPA: hypothetical protein [Caudoviricetes sp.]